MRRLLACCAVGLVLLLPACTASGPTGAGADLDAESERLSAELSGLETVTSVDVALRTGATAGNQVTIEAATSSTEAESQRTVLEQLTRAGWDTAAFVPTEVRTVLVGPDGTTIDPRDLGFPRRGADAAGLFALFGPPAADEDWRP